MKRRHLLACGVTAVALLLAGCKGEEGNVSAPAGGKVEPIAPPAGTDWTQVVEETKDGGFRLGNPNAPVRLLEYGSFGCPHCAEFDHEANQPLQNQYIKSGRVSWEFRSFLLFPMDPAITLLARCNGAEPFFLFKEQLYATQPEWARKIQEGAAQFANLPPKDQLKPMIEASGLDTFFRQRGVPQAKIDACLGDQKALENAFAVSQRGTEQFNVTGTPSFYINDVKISAGTWPEVETQLKRALGE